MNKSTIYLLPGAGGMDPNSYPNFVGEMEKHFKLKRIAYLGFSQIEQYKKYSLENYLESVRNQINKSKETIVIGHSIGATITLLLNEKYPKLIHKQILISPLVICNKKILQYLWDGYKEDNKSIAKLKEDNKKLPPRVFNPSSLKFITKYLQMAKFIRNLKKHEFKLKENKTQTITFIGLDDQLIPPQPQINELKKMPNNKILTYPEQGHYLINHISAEIAQKIKSFIA